MPGRPLALEGACNFRDLGGYRTASGRIVCSGRVFRSDALHRLTTADIDVLEPLGIERIFDLRSEQELRRDGTGPFVASKDHVHMPLIEITLSPFDPDIDWEQVNLQDRYVEMLQVGGPTIRALFEALATSATGSTVFHCTGGKDRTGVVAAILLRLLGVPDDEIIVDYSVSEIHLRSFIDSYRTELLRRGLGAEVVSYLTSSPPERMRHTLTELDARWGSTMAYLRENGVTDDIIGMTRAKLLR